MKCLLVVYKESKHKDMKKVACSCHGDNRVEYSYGKNDKAVICLTFPQPVIPPERSRLYCYTPI